jgi:hypothetical protein
MKIIKNWLELRDYLNQLDGKELKETNIAVSFMGNVSYNGFVIEDGPPIIYIECDGK